MDSIQKHSGQNIKRDALHEGLQICACRMNDVLCAPITREKDIIALLITGSMLQAGLGPSLAYIDNSCGEERTGSNALRMLRTALGNPSLYQGETVLHIRRFRPRSTAQNIHSLVVSYCFLVHCITLILLFNNLFASYTYWCTEVPS